MNIRPLLFFACLLPSLSLVRAAESASSAPPASVTPPAPPAEAVDPSYRLGPGDLVSVHVYGEDLDVTQQLDASGKLRLPLLDEVKLAGQTLREAERSLQWLFRERELLKTPMVTVTLTSVALREASVLGAVRTPGDFPFPNQTRSLSIVDLITRTGGFLPVAKADAVKVTRHNADGTDTTTTVDVESMLSGHHHGADFQVLPGDHIWVPERLF
jgi:protein involved in polysaccharide export with SLBB domain